MRRSVINDPKFFRETHERWRLRVTRDVSAGEAPDEWFEKQCLSCAFYVPLVGVFADDWGVCANAVSPRDGLATFEHDGCDGWDAAEEIPGDSK